MVRNKSFTLIYLIIFCVIQAFLGYFLQGAVGKTYGYVTLSIIVLCFITALVFFKADFLRFITLLALFFTVCADFFLCGLIDFKNIRTVAMLFFSAVQICYFLRLYHNQVYTSEKRFHLILRISLTVIVLIITLFVLKQSVNALAVVSMFYYTNILLNLVYSFIQFKKAPIFALGMLLFVFCDTVLGFSFLPDFLPIKEGSIIDVINNVKINLPWMFYTPSQTLIALDIATKKD